MANIYRTNMVNMAIGCVGTNTPSANTLFMEPYSKWASKRDNYDGSTHWSAVFITYIARMCGVPTAIIPNIDLVDDVLEWADGNDRFFPSWKGYNPKPGDLVVFENINGLDAIIGLYVDHIGNKIDYVAGCYDGREYHVQRSTRIASSGTIVGYIVPDYDWKESKGMVNWTQLSSLVKQIRVEEFHKWILDTYGEEFINRFESDWNKVAIAAWQRSMKFIDEDINGIFDDIVCKMYANDSPIKSASRGNKVMVLIGMLYTKGYDSKGWAVRYGANTEAAVKAFQKARSLDITGIVDYDTLNALFNG